MYKEDLVLNNLQWLISHKTQSPVPICFRILFYFKLRYRRNYLNKIWREDSYDRSTNCVNFMVLQLVENR